MQCELQAQPERAHMNKESPMGKSDENLKAAFAGESQANRKYLAFSKAADKEGLPQVARLFRAAAEAETIHAHNHLRAMGAVGKTADNLKVAFDGETYEFLQMYPTFITDATEDGHRKAQQSFIYANAVEKIHAALYDRAMATLRQGQDMPAAPMWVCQVCGNTLENEPPEKCPVCGSSRDMFRRVD
jgi:rubrerythrin